MEKIACYCQNCRAANNLGETQCRSCGTRLLLVVFPQSLKFDTNHVPSYYEDHLLERVTLLELRLAQVTEQLAMTYEFIKREAKSFQKDRTLLSSFFESLEKTNPELSEILSRETARSSFEKKGKLAFENKREEVLREILVFHGKKQAKLFTHLVKEGFRLLEDNEEKQAFQTLERAVLISRGNVPLNLFIAENLFRVDKFSEAKKYLENLFELDGQNEKVLLLLGAIYADEMQLEKARKLLSVLVDNPQTGSLVNYIWGMLAAFEENWTESLAAFKQCLQNAETPEIYYLIGCVYFGLKNYKNALHYLQKAISLDVKFADAWFMQSVIYKLLEDSENATASIQSALESKEAGAQCLEFLKRQKEPNLETALPFLYFPKTKNFLTKGSLRLTKFLREQIFKSLD
ncbi:MAG TPA: tetratricopeptide repeat protein [Pyrinomonadaceae bacterium]|nr:tetratricopeptide repeat protein [Pyrinomonadaceae bacterium]